LSKSKSTSSIISHQIKKLVLPTKKTSKDEGKDEDEHEDEDEGKGERSQSRNRNRNEPDVHFLRV